MFLLFRDGDVKKQNWWYYQCYVIYIYLTILIMTEGGRCFISDIIVVEFNGFIYNIITVNIIIIDFINTLVVYRLINEMYRRAETKGRYGNNVPRWGNFMVKVAIHQRSTLSSFLFITLLDLILILKERHQYTKYNVICRLHRVNTRSTRQNQNKLRCSNSRVKRERNEN